MAFAQRQIRSPSGAIAIVRGPRSGGPLTGAPSGVLRGPARAGVGLDDAGVEMPPADTLVADVADEEGAVAIFEDDYDSEYQHFGW